MLGRCRSWLRFNDSICGKSITREIQRIYSVYYFILVETGILVISVFIFYLELRRFGDTGGEIGSRTVLEREVLSASFCIDISVVVLDETPGATN